MTGPVTCTVDGKVAHIHIDDGKANALSYALMDAVEAALDEAEASSDARAVVISGRPGRFSAGFDLKVMISGIENAVAMLRRGAALYNRLFTFDKPIVMACTGHALAGGSLLLLTGDLRIGVAGAFRIGLNEVEIGMTLPRLGMELARDRLDPRRLTEATILARQYSPEEAVEVGYLDRVVEPDALLESAMSAARRLAKLNPAAFAGTKLRLREHTVARIADSLEADLAALSIVAGK